MGRRHKNILILVLGAYIALSLLDTMFPYIILGWLAWLVVSWVKRLRGV